jgi:perosamine synthetase
LSDQGRRHVTNDYFIPYGRQSIDDSDRAAVLEALSSDFLTTGPAVERFEVAVAELTGATEVVAVSNGTAALHALYAAADVGPGRNIVTSPLTFASTANAALLLEAEVRFADIDPETGLIDPASVAEQLQERTAAIVAVDYAGAPADYEALRAVAPSGVKVLGDAAHSLGALRGGKQVGTLCEGATVSLHPVKTITSGEGGLVLTDNVDWAKRMREFRHHGITRDGNHALADEGPWACSMTRLGLNYRLTDFQCALGLSQLRRLGSFLARRREIASFYQREMSTLSALRLPVVPPGCESAWHLFVVRVRDLKKRRRFFERLRELGLGVQVHYPPVYWHPYYAAKGYERGLCPNAEAFYQAAISLPIFPAMTEEDCHQVVKRVSRATAEIL